MAVLWLILKVIAVTIMAVFTLLVIILGLILFLPIKYHIFVEKKNKAYCRVKISAFKLIKIHYIWENEEGRAHIYLFGREIKKAGSADNIKKESNKDSQAELKDELESNPQKQEANSTQETHKRNENKKANNTPPDSQKKAVHGDINTLKEKIEYYLEYIKNDDFEGFLKASLRLLQDIYKMVKPYTLRFNLVLGRGDPAETGKWINTIILFYPFYHPYGVIEGAYDKEILEGNLTLLGKLILYDLLKTILLFIMSKDARKYIQFIRNRREEE